MNRIIGQRALTGVFGTFVLGVASSRRGRSISRS
jgi:hypothetical protein